MSKKQKTILLTALNHAILWDQSLIDAHRTEYNIETQQNEVPICFKNFVKDLRKEIAQFQAVKTELLTKR